MPYSITGPRCTTCAAEGRTSSVHLVGLCYSHYMILSAVEKRTAHWEEENAGSMSDALEDLFRLDVVEPKPKLIVPLSPVEAYDRAMKVLDSIPDGTKIKGVGELIRVDGRNLSELAIARVGSTMESCSGGEPDESGEDGYEKFVAGNLYGLAIEMFVTGLELGRSERAA